MKLLWALFVLLYSPPAFAGDNRAAQPVDDLERLIEKISNNSVTADLNAPCASCDAQGNAWKERWTREGWKNLSSQRIHWKESTPKNYDCKKFSHEFTPTFVVARKAGWTEASIRDHLSETAKIYSQCGIRVGSTNVIWDDETPQGLDLDSGKAVKLSMRTPIESKPVVFFVRVPGMAYDAMLKENRADSAYAFAARSFSDPRTEAYRKSAQDTAYMGIEIDTPEYRKSRNFHSRYDTVAHELAHILCNCDHVDGPEDNLLQSYEGLMSGKIKPAQCETFRKSPLTRPLPAAERCN